MGKSLDLVLRVLALHFARLRLFYATALVLLLLVLGTIWYVFIAPPWGFPTGQVLTVSPGESISAVTGELAQAHAVASPILFNLLARVLGGGRGVLSGVYVFSHPSNLFTVAWNLTHGISGIPTIRITFPEGTMTRQMGTMLASSLPNFSADTFDTLAANYSGELFPDTYFFLPGTTETAVVALMHDNYNAHIAKYRDQIAASGHTEAEIIAMASLLEGEGKTLADRRLIAGILWSRIARNMPLGVDATFAYIHDTPGYAPTAADLSLDSPYNLYRHRGLPPTPINNPGDVSITAALTPTKSNYLYYLTGTDGQMHYAKTLAEQVANQKKYLK